MIKKLPKVMAVVWCGIFIVIGGEEISGVENKGGNIEKN